MLLKSKIATTAAMLIGVLVAAGPARAASSPSPEQAIASLNSWRASVSPALLPVAQDPVQTRGCQLHAAHWALNHQTGHSESPGSPGFTAQGNAAAGSSVLSYSSTASLGPLDWDDAPYHRTSLLDPRLATSGFWAEGGISCMGSFGDDEARATPGLTVIPYPQDGKTDVPARFGCNESPNPCDLFDEHPDGAGFGLTVQFNGPGRTLRAPVVTASSLVADGQPQEPYTVVDASSPMSGYLDGGVALFPHRVLYSGTWYTARVAGVWTGESTYDPVSRRELPAPVFPFDRTWRFRTAIGAPQEIQPTITARRQGHAARVRLEADPRFAGARVTARLRPIRWAGSRFSTGRWSTRTFKLSFNGRASITLQQPKIYGRRADGVQVSSRSVDIVERGGTVRLAKGQAYLRAR